MSRATSTPKALGTAYHRLSAIIGASISRGAYDATCHASRNATNPFDVAMMVCWRGSAAEARQEMALIQSTAAAQGYRLEGGMDMEHIVSNPIREWPADAHIIALSYEREPGQSPEARARRKS